MRLPNSYGSVTKLSGKRRKPYAVRITVGWEDDGTQMQKYLSYHKTRQEALKALADFNEHPYDISNHDITFAGLYDRWAEKFYPDGLPGRYVFSYKHCRMLYDLPFIELRRRHLQQVIDDCPAGRATKENIKGLFHQLYLFALDMDIATTDYSVGVRLPEREQSTMHHPFSHDELDALWRSAGTDEGACIALILSYTGMRPSELIGIRRENLHLDEHYMVGGIKTAAGINRVIPIADRIAPIVKRWADQGYERLLWDAEYKEPITTYNRLRVLYWNKSTALRSLPTKHIPHDGRHTFASLAVEARLPLVMIQTIMGHAKGNITQDVYTHLTTKDLIDAVNLL